MTFDFEMSNKTGGFIFLAFFFSLFVTSIAAMLTHIIVCIKAGSWLLLIAGAIAAPVGVIHGIGHWFGAW